MGIYTSLLAIAFCPCQTSTVFTKARLNLCMNHVAILYRREIQSIIRHLLSGRHMVLVFINSPWLTQMIGTKVMPLDKNISMALSYIVHTMLILPGGSSNTPSVSTVCDVPPLPHHGPMTTTLSHYPMVTAKPVKSHLNYS